jgi:iron complex outermembrane receptor protein
MSVRAAASVAVFAAAIALSRPAAAEDTPVLEPVVVEAARLEPERDLGNDAAREAIERVPSNTAIVTEEEIDATRASSLEDVLTPVPGVYVRSRGTGEEPQISIRGSGLRSNFHTRSVNVLIDGFPFQNADGFSEVEAFEFLSAKRIEVYKGGSSVRFAGNTLGGAINIVTETGRDADLFRLRADGGSFDYWRVYGSGGGVVGPWDGFLSGSATASEGYREHAEQDRERAYASAGRSFDGGASLRLDVNGVRNRQEMPGALTPAEFRADPTQANPASVAQDEARDFDYGRGALTLSLPLGDDTRLDGFGQVNYEDLWHPLAFGIIDNETWNGNGELHLASARPLLGLENRLDAGAQFAYTRQPQEIKANLGGVAGPAFSAQVGKAWNASLYLSDDLRLADAVSLVGGLRLQYARREVEDATTGEDSVNYFIVAPLLGAVWRLAPRAEVYANVARSVEPPLIFELTAPGNLAGDLHDLEDQRALQFEIGARGTCFGRLGWDVAVYDVELHDEIRNVNVDPTGMGVFTIPRFENIDRSRHLGVEVAFDLQVARDLLSRLGVPGSDALRWQSSYAFSHFVYVDDPQFGDNALPGVPPHFVWSELRLDHSSGFWFAPRLEAVPEGWYVDSANSVRAPAYALVSARVGYDHEPSRLSVFFEARNLSEKHYVSAVVVDAGDGRYFEPGDGRGFFGGIEWRWR